jgi:hypothetical protein
MALCKLEYITDQYGYKFEFPSQVWWTSPILNLNEICTPFYGSFMALCKLGIMNPYGWKLEMSDSFSKRPTSNCKISCPTVEMLIVGQNKMEEERHALQMRCSSYFLKNALWFLMLLLPRSTRERSWLRHYATSRKVAGSSPDKVDFFNLPIPSSRTMALGST